MITTRQLGTARCTGHHGPVGVRASAVAVLQGSRVALPFAVAINRGGMKVSTK